MPKFTNVWKSTSKQIRAKLREEFTSVAGLKDKRLTDQTFYKRVREVDFTELEKDWWSTKLGIDKGTLFNNE